MNYGAKLKELRMEKSLTQKEVADKLNIKRSTYKDYELQIKIIPIKHLIEVCNIFNVSIDYIFDLNQTPNYINCKNYNIEISSIRLKEFRKENKLTQDKLAKNLNLARSVISDYESEKKIIATPFLYTICKKYNISADYLLGRIDDIKYIKP